MSAQIGEGLSISHLLLIRILMGNPRLWPVYTQPRTVRIAFQGRELAYWDDGIRSETTIGVRL